MQTTIDASDLKELVREVIREEFLSLALNLMPYVSDDEMKEIDATFEDKDFEATDFVDGMAWLGR
jgi:hypothetical protein